jgi:c-di-GMP-binding flagellar brake protein YcgR
MTNRRYTRVLITGIATLKFEEKEKVRSVQTVISNISLGGIGVYSYNPLELNKCVSMTVNFISGDGILKTDSISGHIRCHKKIDNTYFVGIRFNEELNAEHQPLLFRHIREVTAEKRIDEYY